MKKRALDSLFHAAPKRIESYKFMLPPINEQIEIAKILSGIDKKIDVNNKLNKNLEEMAQAIFKRWFIDFEFPNENGGPYKSSGGEMVESDMGLIPEGWKVGTIEKVCEKVGSGGTPSRKVPEYFTGNNLWIKTQELMDSFIFDSEEKITNDAILKSSAKLYPAETVVMAMYGATVGKLGILSSESSFNQAVCAMKVNENIVTYEYLFLHLLNKREHLISLATGSAQQNLSVGTIKNSAIIIPDAQLIVKFKKTIGNLYKLISNNQLEINRLTMVRDTLLPKLMSGEIRVPLDS